MTGWVPSGPRTRCRPGTPQPSDEFSAAVASSRPRTRRSIPARRQRVFSQLGTWCYDRRKLVLGLWLGVLVFGFAVWGAAGNAFRDEFNLPDVESKTGFDILDDNFGGQGTGAGGPIVFRAGQGAEDPEVEAAMQALFDKAAQLDDVTSVESPYSGEGAQQIASEGPEAGRIAYANVGRADAIE